GAIGLDGLHGDFRQIRRKRSAQRAEKIGLRHVGHRDAVELGNGESKRSTAIIGPALAWPVAPGTEKITSSKWGAGKGRPARQPAGSGVNLHIRRLDHMGPALDLALHHGGKLRLA